MRFIVIVRFNVVVRFIVIVNRLFYISCVDAFVSSLESIWIPGAQPTAKKGNAGLRRDVALLIALVHHLAAGGYATDRNLRTHSLHAIDRKSRAIGESRSNPGECQCQKIPRHEFCITNRLNIFHRSGTHWNQPIDSSVAVRWPLRIEGQSICQRGKKMFQNPQHENFDSRNRRHGSSRFLAQPNVAEPNYREEANFDEGQHYDDHNYPPRSSYGYPQQIDRQRARNDQRRYDQGPSWHRDEELQGRRQPHWRQHQSSDWGSIGRPDFEDRGYNQRRDDSGYDRTYGDRNYGEQGYGERGSRDWGYRDEDYRGRDYREGNRDYRDRTYRSERNLDRPYGRRDDEYGYQPSRSGDDASFRQDRSATGGGANWQRTNSGIGGFGDGESAYGISDRNRQRESHAGRGPKGYQRSDERITEDINQRLTDHDDIDASEIEVKVKDGEVTLTGKVCDRQCRRHVEDVIERVSGVQDISNQLKTKKASEQSDSDESYDSQNSPSSRKSGSKASQDATTPSSGSKSGSNG